MVSTVFTRIAHPRVLLTDENPSTRHSLRDALLAQGYQVREAEDGQALLADLGSAMLGELAWPDLVISDQHARVGTPGIEVLSGLRGAGWRLPFVLRTARGESGLEARVQSLGGRSVEKSCAPAHLAGVMREALTRPRGLTPRAGPPMPSRALRRPA